MAANFVKDDSKESLEAQSESESYATSEEKTDSGLVTSSNDTSDTSVQTSDTSGIQSHDLESPEPREAAQPEVSEPSSGAVPPGKSPGKSSFITKAKGFAAKVAKSFSPKKDVSKNEVSTSPKEVVENESSQVKGETTPKRSLVKKCMDKIISPKKTCGLEASNTCETMDVDQSASVRSSDERPASINLATNDENKPSTTSPSEVSPGSTMEGIETDLSSPSSTDETNEVAQPSSVQKEEALEQPKSPENMDETNRASQQSTVQKMVDALEQPKSPENMDESTEVAQQSAVQKLDKALEQPKSPENMEAETNEAAEPSSLQKVDEALEQPKALDNMEKPKEIAQKSLVQEIDEALKQPKSPENMETETNEVAQQSSVQKVDEALEQPKSLENVEGEKVKGESEVAPSGTES